MGSNVGAVVFAGDAQPSHPHTGACHAGGLCEQRSPLQTPAALAGVRAEGWASQPESSAARSLCSGPRPGKHGVRPNLLNVHQPNGSRHSRSQPALPCPAQRMCMWYTGNRDELEQHRLAVSDARSERQQPDQRVSKHRPLLRTPQLRAPELYMSSEDEAAEPAQEAEQQEDVSPVRDHPLAAGIRLGRRGRATVAERKPCQAQHPAKRLRTQPDAPASDGPADGSRALRELPLPARNSGTGSSPARQGCREQPHADTAVDGGGTADLARGFGDLTHMRQYAVEASKALDRLKRKQRTPAKGSRAPKDPGAARLMGGASTAHAHTPTAGAPAPGASTSLEQHSAQLHARPHSRSPPGSSRSAAAHPPASSADEEAAVTASPGAAPLHMRHGVMPSPALAGRCGRPRRVSLIPESPAASLLQLSGSQLQSPTDQHHWRLLSAGTSARPTTSDPSPLQQLHIARCNSPSPRRQRRRLSVGALSDDWLEDPLEDGEDDLLAADDFLAQSPLQLPPLQRDDSDQEQDMTAERLFATARSRGGLRRSSSSPRGLAGGDGIGDLAGTCLLTDRASSAADGCCPEIYTVHHLVTA